jgi:hypothetical protein
MKLKDVLTEIEYLEISRLRILLLNSTSLREARKYKREIVRILNQARERYFNSKQQGIV